MPTPTVRVYASILNGARFPMHTQEARSVGRFWHYTRHLASGTGKATFPIAEAARFFNVAESTIRRWLKTGKENNFFRDYWSRQGVVTIFPVATTKVFRHLGFESLGAVSDIPLDKLKSGKLIATDIQLQQQQRSSEFLAQQQARKEGRRTRTVKPEQLIPPFRRTQSVLVKHCSAKRLFVREPFIPYGASQASVADTLGVSERTINRHLSDKYRQQHGLDPLPRRQICQAGKRHTYEYAQRRLTKSEGGTRNLFSVGREVFKALCCVYLIPWERVSSKAQKRLYRKFLNPQGEGAEAPEIF